MRGPRSAVGWPLALLAGVLVGAPLSFAATSPRPAPACTPVALDASAQLDGAVTVSPMPGSRDASPATQLSFLGVPVSAISHITVVGSQSGIHRGRLLAYSAGNGGSFLPNVGFRAGELVSVTARVRVGGVDQPLTFAFTVASPSILPPTIRAQRPATVQNYASFHSRPDLRPPTVSVTTSSALASPGSIFVTPYAGPGQAGPMILDRSGKVVWYAPLPLHTIATDLRVQQYRGSPVLTWWQGLVNSRGFGLGEGVIDSTSYRPIAIVHAGNGYKVDLHELQLTPQGTALISVYNPVRCDLSAEGGPATGAVTDALLQEIDIRTGLVMFEWTSLDHVPLSASYYTAHDGIADTPYDFFHLNSISVAADGSLIVGSRNTWTATDVNRATGQIIWTLGGKASGFAAGRGAVTAWQHDVRALPGNELSVFDNGASPQEHRQSRGVVLALNLQAKTVSVVAQFLHPGEPLVSDSQGSMQRQPNGDWFVGWGQEPFFSEYSASGTLLFDAHLPTGYQSYRALRFTWSGQPVTKPAIAVLGAADGAHTVYASWNGATSVARWALLAGSSATTLRTVASATRNNFETQLALPAAPGRAYAAVEALDATGHVLGSSAAVRLS